MKSHDLVCIKCGAVLEQEDAKYENPVESRSTTTLFDRHAMGSREVVPKIPATDGLRAYFHGKVVDSDSVKKTKYLSLFSNCCQKLRLGDAESEHALALFKSGSRFISPRKQPIVAVWALYKSCQMYGTPVSDTEIKGTVRTEFGRKSLPDMTKILYTMMKTDVQISKAVNGEKYHFRIMLKKLLGGRKFDSMEYNEKINVSWALFHHIFITGSHSARARQAITMAFGVKR